MDILPSEIILYITTFLTPKEIVNLQLVSRRFLDITRDNNLWRTQCFETSSWETLRRRRELLASNPSEQPLFQGLQKALNGSHGVNNKGAKGWDTQTLKAKANERIRIMANWDPSYPEEKINWYQEYIQRCGPISVSYLEQPRNREHSLKEPMEIRGVGVYNPPSNDGASFVVGPLDDGSICLWDVSGRSETYGKIVGRSAKNTISDPGSNPEAARSRMINTGVTECVSIDSCGGRAYIAVQSELVEVDLKSCQVLSREKFPFSIAAISEAASGTPITVGTNLSLHLYDPRTRSNGSTPFDTPERLDAATLLEPGSPRAKNYFNPQPSNYAPLYQPGPLSIIHIPTTPETWDGNGEIYVAGRFPSILNYDRRYFPRLRGTIHSGARLCSMTSLPHPFTAHLKDRMRRAELSLEQTHEAKALPGNTLVACGEYNTKGSLELYGLSPDPLLSTISSDFSAGRSRNADVLKNRQTSSNSKLLSVSTHGTRIVFSDGNGNLKWVERDGFTEVREWNLTLASIDEPRGIFGPSTSGDIIRKILHTDSRAERGRMTVDNDQLVVWTGEKVGLVTFANKPAFSSTSFEDLAKSAEEAASERKERAYGQSMRKALQWQADELRFLGLGGS